MLPASGRTSPSSIRSSVVLPAPLGPSRPRTSPGRRVRSTASTATVDPKRLTTPHVSDGSHAGNILPPESSRRVNFFVRRKKSHADTKVFTPQPGGLIRVCEEHVTRLDQLTGGSREHSPVAVRQAAPTRADSASARQPCAARRRHGLPGHGGRGNRGGHGVQPLQQPEGRGARTPTACCCRPTSGSRRSARGCSWTTRG